MENYNHFLISNNACVNLYFFWIDYKKEFPDGYQYTQFKFYFKKWLNQNHLKENLSMAIKPGSWRNYLY